MPYKTPAKYLAYQKWYRETHKEQLKAWGLQFRKKHRIRLRNIARARRKRPDEKEKHRVYRQRDYVKERRYFEGTRDTYNLSREQYQAMWKVQDGRCAICKEPFPTRPSANVDHCHLTGKVRGLLCSSCNNGIGRFKEDPTRMLVAIDYLRLHHGNPFE